MASAALGTAYRHLRDLFAAGSTLGLEDGQLLARYSRSNDPAAFEALVGRHGPMVLATCRAVLRNEHDVEDAFQATFLVLARKAGSVRGSEALGGWLHRVAYRASVQASIEGRQRRRKEAEAALVRGDSSRPDSDLAALLHEEIDRLPGVAPAAGRALRPRRPDLRGGRPPARLDLAELPPSPGQRPPAAQRAARPTRGLAPRPRGGHRLERQGGRPPALARLAVASATGAAPSASVALLTHTILRGMLMTKLKIAGLATLASLALASAGVIAAGSGRPDDPTSKSKSAAPPSASTAVKPGEDVEIKGVVVAPDGRPVEGATVTTSYHFVGDDAPSPEATSGPGGRFSIAIPVPSKMPPDVNNYRFPWLVASAPGYGPGHVESILKPGAAAPTIRLVEEGPPIVGRVIDLEGRPVAGARIASEELWFEPGGDLAGWLARARDHGTLGPWKGLMQLPAKLETRADAQGRFRLAGLGRDRLAELFISAPSIATDRVYVRTDDGAEVRAADQKMMSGESTVFHARTFQHASAPTKPVEGAILDKDTGRPIVGVLIRGMVFDESSHIPARGIEARTDERGRYRLAGLPKAPSYRLFLHPARGLPYTNATLVVGADSPGLDPVPFDIKLKRGVVVRGRVTDKATGLPATGFVDAYTFEDNPHVAEFPGYRGSYRSQVGLDVDGRYEVVTPPGQGIIACRSNDRLYRGGVGAESIKAPFDTRFKNFATEPEPCHVGDYHALAGVDLDPKVESATVDLQVDPGHTLEVAVVDPEGRPVGRHEGLGPPRPPPERLLTGPGVLDAPGPRPVGRQAPTSDRRPRRPQADRLGLPHGGRGQPDDPPAPALGRDHRAGRRRRRAPSQGHHPDDPGGDRPGPSRSRGHPAGHPVQHRHPGRPRWPIPGRGAHPWPQVRGGGRQWGHGTRQALQGRGRRPRRGQGPWRPQDPADRALRSSVADPMHLAEFSRKMSRWDDDDSPLKGRTG